MKRILLWLAVLIAALLAVMAFRTSRFNSKQVQVQAVGEIPVDPAAAERFSRALQFQTISHQDPLQNQDEEFASLRAHLEASFPQVHSTLLREVIAGKSLLFEWKGRDTSAKPILLMAHMDVVPVEEGTEQGWKYPPFAGTIAEGFIWGRGALDDKVGVLEILQATEMLLRSGFQPNRTIYFAFGHDEEIGGPQGAGNMAAWFRSRNISFDYILDEGMVITHDLFPGISSRVAMVGVAEKGYLSVELKVEGEGGHSSMPPRQTSIGILSDAVTRLEEHPLPAAIKSPVREMFESIGPEMNFGNKFILANLWLLGGVFKMVLATNQDTDAMLRTTTAPTIFQSGTKENVLPGRARAVVNFRILPENTIAGVLDHVRKTIADDRVKVNQLIPANEPSSVSSPHSPNFHLLERTIREVFPDVLVTPALLMGGTDTKHYAGLSRDIYRFGPANIGPEDLPRIHGTNERIAVKDYENGVRFYHQLLLNSSRSEIKRTKLISD